MKFIIIDGYYGAFVKDFYTRHPECTRLGFAAHRNLLLTEQFGTGDFYSKNLRLLGHEAQEIIANDFILQRKWLKEHSIRQNSLKSLFSRLPFFGRFTQDWINQTLYRQIAELKPDICYTQGIYTDRKFLQNIKRHIKLLVGQIASPLPAAGIPAEYNLVVTALPSFVPLIRKFRVASEYFRLGFESSLVETLPPASQKKYEAVFIGDLDTVREKEFGRLAREQKLDFWGSGLEKIQDPAIKSRHHGLVWGGEMYKRLGESKICVNKHRDFAGSFAANMRMYEVTGMGAMLITDYKDNLDEIFKIGKEVVAYRNNVELEQAVTYYLRHEDERKQIAQAGQRRTMKDHSYFKRMQELLKILDKYL